MRFSLLYKGCSILILLVLFSCKTNKDVVSEEQELKQAEEAMEDISDDSEADVAVEITEEGTEVEHSFDFLGKSLQKAIQGEMSMIKSFYPSVAFARILSPSETKGLSDKDIQIKMLSALESSLISNLENIREDAKSKKIDLNTLKFESFESTEADDSPNKPQVMLFAIGNEQWNANVPVTYIKTDGIIYLFEILISRNLFKEKA